MKLPKDFETYTRQLFGDCLYRKFRQALDEEAPTSIRLNPFKPHAPNLQDGPNSNHEPVAWCPQGWYLGNRPTFTFDPLLHAGLYYVQEASSMFVCEVVKQIIHEPVLMLDLCAAPGGKSTALRSALPEGSLLFSNEPVKTRASILKENMQKQGHPDVIATNNFPKDYRKSKLMFDAILADVPCSGEGMFRKDPNSIQEWSQQNVEKCRLLQRSIIEDAWHCLRPGGFLIYSTCTFNAHEDEENAEWITKTLDADFIDIKTKEEWNISGPLVGSNPAYRFIPGVTRGEGLFMTVLRKRGDSARTHNNTPTCHPKQAKNIDKTRNWLNGDFTYVEEKDTITAIPSRWIGMYNNVRNKLHVIHAGVGIGTIKGKDIIPDNSLALSMALNREAFNIAELDHDTAIRYLRKEAITLDAATPKGFAIVAYKGHPLGFVKNLGNRANNLYPQEWRIKSTHVASNAQSPILPHQPEEAQP